MRCILPVPSTSCRADAHECEATGRQTEVNQLDERIAMLQSNEHAQYATISSLETSLDNQHAHLSNLEARMAELEAAGDPDLSMLREMSQKQVEIASILRQLISDNQGQAQARAKIIESQRQQLTARHRRNLLKQVGGPVAPGTAFIMNVCQQPSASRNRTVHSVQCSVGI